MADNREDNNSLSEFEYNTIKKYVNYYYNKYSLSIYKYNDFYKDFIFSKAIKNYLDHRDGTITNEKILAKYISLSVKSVVINYFKNKSNSYSNDSSEKLEVYKIDEQNFKNNVYSEFDTFTFYETLTTCVLKLTDKERMLLSYLIDNTDSYKESISKICKELSFTRYEYDKYINKIQNLFNEYYY